MAGLTFKDLGEDRFAHAYQSKNLMRQIAGSFASAIAAITLQERQFANHADLAGRLGAAQVQASGWFDSLQASFAAHGLPAADARRAALAELARAVEQQSLLLSCEDLYRLLAALALGAAVLIVVQRRLK